MTTINGFGSSVLGGVTSGSAAGSSSLDGSGQSAGNASRSSPAGTTDISRPGQLFSELQQLSQSNPTEFKAVATQLAQSFKEAASHASGQDAQVLNKLSDTFNQAAQTGTLSAPQQHGHGMHGHHRAHSSGSGGPSSAITEAFQNALSIVDAANQGALPDASAASASPS